MIEYWYLFPLIGLVAGVMAGMFGIGGGLIVVPAMSYLFILIDPDGGYRMHAAVGTSLASIIFTSIPAVVTHDRAGFVLRATAIRLGPAMAIGSLIGAGLAGALSGPTLRHFVGLVVLCAGIYILSGRKPAGNRRMPRIVVTSGSGAIIGIVSALSGIGGGLLTTPWLLWHGRGIREAIGTSAACTLPVAVAGAVGFVIAGWPDGDGLPFSTGYVFWPGVIGIVSGSMIAAVSGARLAHRTPATGLRRLFALLLAGVGVEMLVG